MHRIVVLDTETTGIDPKNGHRIIEIGCVEIINRDITENYYHQFINPEREIDQGAFNVHGLSEEFLSDKPLFQEIAPGFIDFIKDSELVIHNAPFDVGFLDSELHQLQGDYKKVASYCKIIDSLVLARKMHIGQKNSLDALCKRYEVNNSERTLHGALLDAQLLAQVYLKLTGGQVAMKLNVSYESNLKNNGHTAYVSQKRKLTVIKASGTEIENHQKKLQEITNISGKETIW